MVSFLNLCETDPRVGLCIQYSSKQNREPNLCVGSIKKKIKSKLHRYKKTNLDYELNRSKPNLKLVLKEYRTKNHTKYSWCTGLLAPIIDIFFDLVRPNKVLDTPTEIDPNYMLKAFYYSLE